MKRETAKEYQAWQKIVQIISEKSAEDGCGSHAVNSDCTLFGCRLFAAIHEWGNVLVE